MTSKEQLLSTLSISSLDPDVDSKELFKLFSKYGNIKITRPKETKAYVSPKEVTVLIQYSTKEEGILFKNLYITSLYSC